MVDMKKGARITGANRDKLASQLTKKYENGASIRELAASSGRSYGFVHRVLSESGAAMRGRGGATRAGAPGGGGKDNGTARAVKGQTTSTGSPAAKAAASRSGRASRKTSGRTTLRSVT